MRLSAGKMLFRGKSCYQERKPACGIRVRLLSGKEAVIGFMHTAVDRKEEGVICLYRKWKSQYMTGRTAEIAEYRIAEYGNERDTKKKKAGTADSGEQPGGAEGRRDLRGGCGLYRR